MGSASLTNCITSSMDQDDGFLLGSAAASRSEPPASGPVVELAAARTTHTSDRDQHSSVQYSVKVLIPHEVKN